MRQSLALLMTTWFGVSIAAILWLGEIILFTAIVNLAGVSLSDSTWVYWVLIILNAIVVNYLFYSWPKRLRQEGKKFLEEKNASNN